MTLLVFVVLCGHGHHGVSVLYTIAHLHFLLLQFLS